MMVERTYRRLSPEAWRMLRRVSTATLTSQLLKAGFRNTFLSGVAPLRPDLRLLGYAFTLRYVPAREDLDMQVDYDNATNVQRLAVETIEPDEVLVIDARGETRAASFGHIIATRIMRRGAAGLVSDGALRDTPRFRTLDLPVYAQAAHATTSSVMHHPVDMNVPVACGGVQVQPGDLIAGDAEGVVVIPAHVAEDVALAAGRQDELEEFVLGKVQRGADIRGVYPPDATTRAEYEAQRTDKTHGGGA
ncbi:MAG TPA: ribonuclease activity regulator RraA [bacterium]|nr:ribonuclease activity regulator RraA [bacterium]